MKYYSDFAQKKILSFSDVETIVGNSNTAARIVSDYEDKGLLQKIKKNLYAVVSLENGGLVPDEFEIGCALKPDAFISHHSAFRFHGFYNQVYSTIDVSSPTRFDTLLFGGKEYRHHHSSWLGEIETVGNGKRVSTVERTIVDSIKDLRKTMDLEELLRCVEMVPRIKDKALIDCMTAYKNRLLWKKVGYFLQNCRLRYELPVSFFEYCRKNGGNVVGYFSSEDSSSQQYDKEWKMYVPLLKNDEYEVPVDVSL